MNFTKSESLRIFLGYLLGYFGLQLILGFAYGLYYVTKYSTLVPDELQPKAGAIILIISSCVVFILLLLVAKKRLRNDLNLLYKKRLFGGIFFGFGIIFLINLVFGILYNWLGLEVNPENQRMLNEMIGFAPALMLVATSILIPLVEEIVFRGVILEFFEKRVGAILGILLSSILFGFMHVTDPASYIFLPIYVAPGILFGILYIKYDKNLWIPIGAHLLNNLFVVMIQIFVV